ncbi:Arc family DNA-binding protein (plasmid) [Acinetobacter defluvii]|uniref:Arc family DNA-binding protein n=2 Tax=Acinetobacter defluvii TaxID=1871111 RepID=A0A2S2F869_9GAMM|nr:Arc family DNA-binding protein [Acinetobacter defluvii]
MGNLANVEYKMRMTQNLKDKIIESGKEHNRSMNAEIIHRLEKSFKTTCTGVEHVETDILLAVLAERLAKNDCEIKISKK